MRILASKMTPAGDPPPRRSGDHPPPRIVQRIDACALSAHACAAVDAITRLVTLLGAEPDFLTVDAAGATIYLRSCGQLPAWLDAQRTGWRSSGDAEVAEIETGVFAVFTEPKAAE